MRYFLGIDIGSIAVKAALLDQDQNVVEEHYLRISGEPERIARKLIENIHGRFQIGRLAPTGSGGKLIGGEFINEIIAQSRAVARLHPEIRTVIEMGGEDSKLLLMEKGKLVDFSTNNICAAGTGSFLDQQASRLGLAVEEFGKLALRSKNPPRIAGRCTVFAKSDMIHLQQKGTPDYEIVAGLCLAVARNFVSGVGKGIKWKKPIAFQGGVAANAGMVRAFEQVLGLSPGELVIPRHYASMGAIGAIISSMPPPLPLPALRVEPQGETGRQGLGEGDIGGEGR